jgi:uncharacterized protein (TIGR03435 family)
VKAFITIAVLAPTALPAAQDSPAFEVASVKPTDPARVGSTFNFAPGQLQIAGGITAANDAALKDLDKQTRTKEMRRRLQTLLADRFQLTIHRETREWQEYSLVVAKSGLKLKPAEPGAGNGINSGCGVMKGTRMTMSNFAMMLSRQLGRPVLDNTGLSQQYDFEINFTPEAGCGPRPVDGGASTNENPPENPSIFTPIQAQTGLKLEPIKGPVEVILIDRAEKPEAN